MCSPRFDLGPASCDPLDFPAKKKNGQSFFLCDPLVPFLFPPANHWPQHAIGRFRFPYVFFVVPAGRRRVGSISPFLHCQKRRSKGHDINPVKLKLFDVRFHAFKAPRKLPP